MIVDDLKKLPMLMIRAEIHQKELKRNWDLLQNDQFEKIHMILLVEVDDDK
jgi:hypothetical protein